MSEPKLSNAAAFGEKYYLLTEVAELTRSSLSTVRWWVSQGRLKTTKPGMRVLVADSELRAFLAKAGQK